jgi:transposase, IS5 family
LHQFEARNSSDCAIFDRHGWVLKHVRQWSFEELEWEVTGNVAYRAFCRMDSGKVPDAKTMIRINQAVDEATLRRVFERVVDEAKRRRVTRGRKMRVDTTVVETGLRYPLDSALCEGVTRVACREMERVRAAGLPVPDTFRNVRRSVARRLYEIEQVGRRPAPAQPMSLGPRRALRRYEHDIECRPQNAESASAIPRGSWICSAWLAPGSTNASA